MGINSLLFLSLALSKHDFILNERAPLSGQSSQSDDTIARVPKKNHPVEVKGSKGGSLVVHTFLYNIRCC